jgi:Ca2+/H+ antiporter
MRQSLLLLSLPERILIFDTDYVNVLLFFVPLGIVAGVSEWSPTLVFTLNFLAIVPLNVPSLIWIIESIAEG